MWTNDPVADADNYFAEQEREMERLPLCECCGDHVTDDFYYDIDGEILCEECLNEKYRKDVDDFG